LATARPCSNFSLTRLVSSYLVSRAALGSAATGAFSSSQESVKGSLSLLSTHLTASLSVSGVPSLLLPLVTARAPFPFASTHYARLQRHRSGSSPHLASPHLTSLYLTSVTSAHLASSSPGHPKPGSQSGCNLTSNPPSDLPPSTALRAVDCKSEQGASTPHRLSPTHGTSSLGRATLLLLVVRLLSVESSPLTTASS
jgi:hypothetical protein